MTTRRTKLIWSHFGGLVTLAAVLQVPWVVGCKDCPPLDSPTNVKEGHETAMDLPDVVWVKLDRNEVYVDGSLKTRIESASWLALDSDGTGYSGSVPARILIRVRGVARSVRYVRRESAGADDVWAWQREPE